MKLNVEKIKEIIDQNEVYALAQRELVVSFDKGGETFRINAQLERDEDKLVRVVRITTIKRNISCVSEYYEAETPEVIEIYKYMAKKFTKDFGDLFVE